MLKLNLITLALAVILVPAIVLATHAWAIPWTASRILGMSIAIPAFLLLCLARLQLGRAFSVQAKATTLVTTGLYARIRNPIYFFGALVFAGIIVWMGRPWWFAVLAVVLVLQVYRARKESQVLEQKFGAAYREYRRKTWF